MEIQFNKHDHFEVTDALRSYTEQKLGPLVKQFDRMTRITVTFSIEKLIESVEATIHLPGTDIHAVSKEENMYAAIDRLVDKLDRQLKKYKEKLTDHRH